MKEIRWENAEERRDDFDVLIPCIEKAFLLTFPEDFKACAIAHGGGRPVPSRFDVGDTKGKVCAKLLSLDPRSKDFFWKYYASTGWNLRGYGRGPYPIALDREGNSICLDYEKGFPPRIVYVTARKISPQKFALSNSFTQFLERLY